MTSLIVRPVRVAGGKEYFTSSVPGTNENKILGKWCSKPAVEADLCSPALSFPTKGLDELEAKHLGLGARSCSGRLLISRSFASGGTSRKEFFVRGKARTPQYNGR